MSREGDGSGGNTSQSLSLLFFAPLPSAKLLARGGEEWARRGEEGLGAVPGGRRAGSVRGVFWGFCRQVTPSPRAEGAAGRSSLMLAAPLSPFGPGLLSASASTCPDHPPPGSRRGEGRCQMGFPYIFPYSAAPCLFANPPNNSCQTTI